MLDEDFGLLLDCELLDEDYLHGAFSLTRRNRDEFVRRYGELAAAQRPTLSRFFDAEWYRSAYDDIGGAGIDPFLHFVIQGVFELRAPHPFISVARIYDDNRALFYREGGCRSLSRVLGENRSDPCDYFDLEFYLQRYIEARDYTGGALRHFLDFGEREWLWPNPYFDPQWYSEHTPEIPANAVAALRHFIETGDRLGRSPSAQFDSQWYRGSYADVAADDRPPLRHFLTVGRREGRQARAARRPPLVAGGLTPVSEAEVSFEPATTTNGLARYEAIRARVAERRQTRLEAFDEIDVRPVRVGDVRAAISSLAFPIPATAPKVSILIPCHNGIDVTVECLLSILASKPGLSYEVIIGDNASVELAYRDLAEIPGLRYFRHPVDLNFLRNCNAIFPEVRGEYVLLLNNDAQVTPGAIDILAAALDAKPGLAAVGPQILFPNGRLQEAGCAINRDGSTVMIGVFEDPELDGYKYCREVDYISGAALMVRSSEIEGSLFDERFAPAYCEDLDLCLTLSSRGKKVEYVPQAKVVHHLSLTMAKASQGWKLEQIARNQQKLVEKWGRRLDTMNTVRAIAFYLPQFHPIPQNDMWWGAGFTEWINVARARPSYAGQHQPRLPADLGFYDLRMPQVLRQQAALAARYGLAGFCVYYYRLGGMRLLEGPLETILANPDIPFPFCICWANESWSRRWDGGDQEVLAEQRYDAEQLDAIAEDVVRYISDPRYIAVEGKPLVLIYRVLLLPDPRTTAARLREAAAAVGKELHLVYVESMETVGEGIAPADLGFDAAVEFPPHGIGVQASDERPALKPDWHGHRYDYEATVVEAIMRPKTDYRRYPGVFPGWDNTPRQPLLGTSFDNASPEVFQFYVEEKLAEARVSFVGEERLLFVNAWNEWAEGAYLEPDQHFGHRWLEALRNALAAH